MLDLFSSLISIAMKIPVEQQHQLGLESKAMEFPGIPASLSNSTITCTAEARNCCLVYFFIGVTSQKDVLFPTKHNVVH